MNLTANTLKQQGIDNAIAGANNACPNWSDTAYTYLLEYLQTVSAFLTEDFRQWCKDEKQFEAPKSKRAFGGIVQRAQFNELIKSVGVGNVKNKKAHGAYAATWVVLAKAKKREPVKVYEQISMFGV